MRPRGFTVVKLISFQVQHRLFHSELCHTARCLCVNRRKEEVSASREPIQAPECCCTLESVYVAFGSLSRLYVCEISSQAPSMCSYVAMLIKIKEKQCLSTNQNHKFSL